MKGQNDNPIRPSPPADAKDDSLFDSLAADHVRAIWVSSNATDRSAPPAAPQVPPDQPVEDVSPARTEEEVEPMDPALEEKLRAVAKKWGVELPIEAERGPLLGSAVPAATLAESPAPRTKGRFTGLSAQAAAIVLGAAASGLLAWLLLFR